MFFDQVLAFDHVKKEIHLIVTADLTRNKGDAYAHAVRRLNKLEKRLAQALPKPTKKKPFSGKPSANWSLAPAKPPS